MTDAEHPRPALPTIVTWGAILASILVVSRLADLQHRPAARDSGRSSRLEFAVRARLVLGASELINRSDPAMGSRFAPALTGPLREAVRRSTNPDVRIRAVPVLVEVVRPDRAQVLLEEVLSEGPAPTSTEDARILRGLYGAAPARPDPAALERFVKRHGWFARLALAHGKGAGDPGRQEAVLPAVQAFLGLTTALCVFGVLFPIGVVLLLVAFVKWWNGTLSRAFRPQSHDGAPYLEAFALTMVFHAAAGVATFLAEDPPAFVKPLVFTVWALLPIWWLRRRGVGLDELKLALGFSTGKGLIRETLCGVVGWITGLPVVVAAAILVALLARLGGGAPIHPIVNALGGDGWAVFRVFLLGSVVAPIVEEIHFRGVFMNHLRGHHGWIVSASVQGLVFALLHPQGLTAVPALAVLGMVLAAIREWRGTIVASIAAHSLQNTVALTTAFFIMR